MTRGAQYHDSGFIGTDYRPFDDHVDVDIDFEKPRNISTAGVPLYSDEGVSIWIRHLDTISHHLVMTAEQFEQFCSAIDVMRTKVSFDVLEYREKKEAAQRVTAE